MYVLVRAGAGDFIKLAKVHRGVGLHGTRVPGIAHMLSVSKPRAWDCLSRNQRRNGAPLSRIRRCAAKSACLQAGHKDLRNSTTEGSMVLTAAGAASAAR